MTRFLCLHPLSLLALQQLHMFLDIWTFFVQSPQGMPKHIRRRHMTTKQGTENCLPSPPRDQDFFFHRETLAPSTPTVDVEMLKKTSRTISTMAILWPVKGIFEKRAAMVEVDTFISPVKLPWPQFLYRCLIWRSLRHLGPHQLPWLKHGY